MKNLIIIVPTYNEAATIGPTVQALKIVIPQLAEYGTACRIWVVNDGSTDDTARSAREAGADRILHHKSNLGLGAAVRTGLAAARAERADIVVKFDADLQHDPNDIPALIQPILADEADLVYGNRFARMEYVLPFVRRIGNRFFTALVRWLTGWPLRDAQPGIFAAAKAYLDVFYLPGNYNYTQQVLIDAYHKGMRFAHCSVTFRPRKSGRSFVTLRYPFKVFPQILLVIASVNPMRLFAPIGLLFILAAGIIFSVELTLWLMHQTLKPVLHVNAVLGLSLFGLQTLFFGIIAELINQMRNQDK